MKKSVIFSICTIVLGALGLIFALFLPGIKAEFMGISDTISGAKVMFGDGGFDFSFMMLIGLLCAIAGIVFAVLALVGKGGQIFTILGIVTLVIAAVFTFMTLQFAMVDGKMFNDWGGLYKLGIGAILGGIFYILAAVTSALPLFIKD